MWPPETSTEKQRTVIGEEGTQCWRTSLAIMQQQQGAIMKLATLGLATALAFTSSFALAQSGAARQAEARHGRRGNERHDDRISRGWHDNGQCDGKPPHRHVQQRRQRRGRREQRTEPVGEYADQSLAQRFDADAGTRRPIIARPTTKSPAGGAFSFASSQAVTSSLPAAFCISRRRASPVGRALRARARWHRARRWRDPESAFSPPRSRPRSWPRHSVSR